MAKSAFILDWTAKVTTGQPWIVSFMKFNQTDLTARRRDLRSRAESEQANHSLAKWEL
jgi:hypothetical protein